MRGVMQRFDANFEFCRANEADLAVPSQTIT